MEVHSQMLHMGSEESEEFFLQLLNIQFSKHIPPDLIPHEIKNHAAEIGW